MSQHGENTDFDKKNTDAEMSGKIGDAKRKALPKQMLVIRGYSIID